MQIVLTVVLDVERNLVRVERAGIRGLGDLESELKVKGVDPNEPGGDIELEAAGLPADTREVVPPPPRPPAPPGNLMRPISTKAVKSAYDQAGVIEKLMLLGLDETQAAGIIENHAMERIIKLVNWVRQVQAKEGCSRPDSLFMRCLAKGVQ